MNAAPVAAFRLILFAVLCGGLAVAGPVAAQWTEGTHYEAIGGPDVADDDGEIEVVEVFSYMCPHCRNFQPYVEPWAEELAEGVTFSRVPVTFNRSWEPFARAFETAKVLGILDESHDALFAALHDERRPLRSLDDLAEFHSQFGVDAARFESTAGSFPVEAALRKGRADLGKWGIRSTPTLVINGKWRVSPRRGSTFEEMLEVADFLIERERADAGIAAAAES